MRLTGHAMLGRALGGCRVPRPVAARPSRAPSIHAVCFDLFTLFDPAHVVDVAAGVLGDAALSFCEMWRTRTFLHAFLRAAGDRYVDFTTITERALYEVERARGLSLTDNARVRLLRAHTELDPWPDARDALAALTARGLLLAPLTNYAPAALDTLLARSRLAGFFDARLSTDAARTFKPDPRAYALGPSAFGLPARSIAFAAYAGWDVAGATWFGFPTVWIDRGAPSGDTLDAVPEATGRTLETLIAYVARRP